MKTVQVTKDVSVRVKRSVFIQYRGGKRYERVPEAHVRAIVAAKSGEVVEA